MLELKQQGFGQQPYIMIHNTYDTQNLPVKLKRSQSMLPLIFKSNGLSLKGNDKIVINELLLMLIQILTLYAQRKCHAVFNLRNHVCNENNNPHPSKKQPDQTL